MFWPRARDYREAIQNLQVSFRDPELSAGQALTDATGMPMTWTGNFAAVFQVRGATAQRTRAVKCFTRHVDGLQERYREIHAHLDQQRLPFMVGFSYLPDEVLVSGRRYPAVKMDWVEGLRLDEFLADCFRKGNAKGTLRMLCDMWVKLAQRMRAAEIAHGDLQHGNVILVPVADKEAYNLRLIDYDGMYVPALAHLPPGEVGHAAYQHPERLATRAYGPEIDRFSHLLIYTSLRCLVAGGQRLWDAHYDGDRLLIGSHDLAAPEDSAVFRELWQLDDSAARSLVGHLILAARGGIHATPWLGELLYHGNVVSLTPQEQRQLDQFLLRTPSEPVPSAPAEATPAEPAPDSTPEQADAPQPETAMAVGLAGVVSAAPFRGWGTLLESGFQWTPQIALAMAGAVVGGFAVAATVIVAVAMIFFRGSEDRESEGEVNVVASVAATDLTSDAATDVPEPSDPPEEASISDPVVEILSPPPGKPTEPAVTDTEQLTGPKADVEPAGPEEMKAVDEPQNEASATDEKQTPEPPPSKEPPVPTSKPAPSLPNKRPFADLAARLALPDWDSPEAMEPKSLGSIYIPPGELCFIRLRGGQGAYPGEYEIAMRNADGGLAERDWEIFTRRISDGTECPIARLCVTDDARLTFQWQPEAKTQPAATYLANCALSLACVGESHTAVFREPQRLEGAAGEPQNEEPATDELQMPEPRLPPEPPKLASKELPKWPGMRPFVHLAAGLALPHLDSPEPMEPKSLGSIYIPAGGLCTIQLCGGRGAYPGNYEIVMRNADEGRAERDWEILTRRMSDRTECPIAHLCVTDDACVTFRWQPEAKTQPAAAYLVNCALRLACDGDSHTATFREPQRLKGMAVDFDGPATRQEWTIDCCPDPRRIKLRITGVRGAQGTAKPSEVVPTGKRDVWLPLKDGDGSVSLKLEIVMQRTFRINVLPHIQWSPNEPPQRFESKELRAKFAFTERALNVANQGLRSVRPPSLFNDATFGEIARQREFYQAAIRTAEENKARLLFLDKLLTSLSGQVRIEFRLTYEADATTVDLLEVGDAA